MMNSLKQTTVLGIIGGSGVYEMSGVEVISKHPLTTPFGCASDEVAELKIEGRTAYFIPRHGQGHRLTPSEVPYRANIHALKQMGVTHLLAVSAVGIMKEHIRPGDMIIPDQIFDRTKDIRPHTFFGNGIVGHVSMADPFCDELANVVTAATRKCDAAVHEGGTYVCMEGPQFSTRAESFFYKDAIDASVIGMTAIPEARPRSLEGNQLAIIRLPFGGAAASPNPIRALMTAKDPMTPSAEAKNSSPANAVTAVNVDHQSMAHAITRRGP